MLERDFQAKLVKELKQKLPDAVIFKNDAKQGMPDLLILCGERWAALECKIGINAPHRPNQDYYVNKMCSMGFATFVYPENKDVVVKNILDWFDIQR